MYVEVFTKNEIYATINEPHMLEIWSAIRAVQSKLDSKLVEKPTSDGIFAYSRTADTTGWVTGITRATFDSHATDTGNPHSVTADQIGAASASTVASHIGNKNNPHGVTAAQIGAASASTVASHISDTSNPHNVTAAQVGAATAGDLTSHIGNKNNPHSVTAAQTGAVPAAGGTFTGSVWFNSSASVHKYFEVGNYDGTADKMQSFFRNSTWNLQARKADGSIDPGMVLSISGSLAASGNVTASGSIRVKAPSGGNAHYWMQRSDTTATGLLYWDHGDKTLKLALYNDSGTTQISRITLKSNGNAALLGAPTPVTPEDIVTKKYVDSETGKQQNFTVVNSSAGPVTHNLPANPSVRLRVKVNTGNYAATNKVTISGNGKNINLRGVVDTTLETTTNSITLEFIYDGTQWRVS